MGARSPKVRSSSETARGGVEVVDSLRLLQSCMGLFLFAIYLSIVLLEDGDVPRYDRRHLSNYSVVTPSPFRSSPRKVSESTLETEQLCARENVRLEAHIRRLICCFELILFAYPCCVQRSFQEGYIQVFISDIVLAHAIHFDIQLYELRVSAFTFGLMIVKAVTIL